MNDSDDRGDTMIGTMTAQQLPRVGIDVGGTFTDFVVFDAGGARVHKLSTTPDDQSRAIVAGLRALELPAAQIVHGMTVATNALLERKGARTALLTTAGFGDVLTIGRQNRPELYALHQERPPSLVAPGLIFEVAERIAADGTVVTELDKAAIDALADALAQMRAEEAPESLALCFLFAFRNPVHEARAAQLLQARLPDLPLSLSSEILPEYREYERMATTVINAYVQPPVGRYLQRLERALGGDHSVHIMQSNGGLIAIEQAQHGAARLVLSGPAGGVVGAFAVAQATVEEGEPVNLLTFDMGGTSTDVALCPNRIPTTAESTIGALPLRLPMIDIHTVGAGGGSIARVDAGGALRVGPQSAGAQPGPVCYGRGGVEPTVTDANLVLGRLEAGAALGGGDSSGSDVRLDYDAAYRALARLGEQLGLAPEAAALGVLRVANATMERALRTVSVERGHDPRTFTLLPFGGAGPLHACELADLLQIPRVLVPPFPGVLSAWGMLAAPLVSDASLSILAPADAVMNDPARLAESIAEMSGRLTAVLKEGEAPVISAALDMRYRGQSYELSAPLELPASSENVARSIDVFHRLHEQRYGYAMRDEGVEVVTLRVRAESPVTAPMTPRSPLQGTDASHARSGERPVWFSADAPLMASIYDRSRLAVGNRLEGPAMVTQYDTITLLPPGWCATVDALHNLALERNNPQ